MAATIPKSLTETIGPAALRKKIEEEVGLPDLLPRELMREVTVYNPEAFVSIIPRIEGFGVKCQGLVKYIDSTNPNFRKYLANYMDIQVMINKAVNAEHKLFNHLLVQITHFNSIRQKVGSLPALGPSWLQYAIPRPVLTSYGYITYFIAQNPRYQAIVTNHQPILRWIFDNAHEIDSKMYHSAIIEDYIRRFDIEASTLRRYKYRLGEETVAEIYYNYYMKHFINEQPLNVLILHNYMRRYDIPEPKPVRRNITRRSPPNARLPNMRTPTPTATNIRKIKQRSPSIITEPTILPREVITPRANPRRANITRRQISPPRHRSPQATPALRLSPPYISPPTPSNSNSVASNNSFVTARGN